MKKVKILLSAKTQPTAYIDALEGVGAAAVWQYPPKFDDEYDGLVLCGGADIDPARYGEEINGSVGIDAERDAVEFELMQAFIDAGKPVLGVCRGHQFVNVFFGGSLHQDIPEAELHRGGKAHLVAAVDDSILYSLYGGEFSVNSTHHQAVKALGHGLRATAVWNEKYVEATEHISLPVMSVQWHPEGMCFDRRREDTVDGARIFEYFVSLCKEHSKK